MVYKTLKKTKPKHRLNARKWGVYKLKSVGVFYINTKSIASAKSIEIEKEFFNLFGRGLVSSYLDEMKKRVDKSNTDFSYVYFIGNYHFGFVKIGYSSCPERRLKQIQTGCPFNVSILGKMNGNAKKEKELHRKFQKNKTKGEWFVISDEIKNLIESCKIQIQ